MESDRWTHQRRILRVERKLCPHCSKFLSLKTFKAHKRRYYDDSTGLWLKKSSPDKHSNAIPQEKGQEQDDEQIPSFTFQNHTLIDTSDGSEPPHILDQQSSLGIIDDCTKFTPDKECNDDEDYEIWNDITGANDDMHMLFDVSTSDHDEEPDIDITFNASSNSSFTLVRWLLAFFFKLQAAFYISDRAIECIFRFLAAFFVVMSKLYPLIKDIATSLPTTMYKAKQILHLQYKPSKMYVVCRKCHQLYYLKECIERIGGMQRSRCCQFVQFPNHPHKSMRQPCGEILLKTVELASQKVYLYPFKTYCYLGLEQSLQFLLNRPSLFESCQHWRTQTTRSDVRNDVYDGQVWKDYQMYNNEPFLQDESMIALMMNMDFFKPYKQLQYSVGAIYLTVLNLTREPRHKPENVILVGLIPGPHEPERDINSFLSPLVRDLLVFFKGMDLDILSCKRKIRCALLCIACDLPAGRKVCGFLGTAAKLGCSRCLKQFPGTVGSMDYSGFDRDTWPQRANRLHRDASESLLSAKSKAELQTLESLKGCRYSELLRLPYFDPVRMLIIDPMHNLFLGSAKRVVKHIWINKGIIPTNNFYAIGQLRVRDKKFN